MKTLKTRIQRLIQGISFSILNIIPLSAVIILVSLSGCTTPYMVSHNPHSEYMPPPSWAQDFDTEYPVNYYYLPDIECYYDLRNREFVYMESGNWRFSASLPSIYASFNLNNCFVVKLNNEVVEPWMHFHYYVAHYPRYFYKSIERENYHNYGHAPRWFNENIKHYGYNNGKENNDYKENKSAREDYGHDQNRYNTNNRENNRAQKNEGSVNREQPMKYYGKQIGEPVKVLRNMRKPQDNKGGAKRQETKERKNE
jgi:hypothetical protein